MKKKCRNIPLKVISYLILIMLIIFSIFPAVWMVLTSIKPATEIYKSPPEFFANDPTIENYKQTINSNVPRAFLNSTIVTFSTIILTLVIAIPAGYGLIKNRSKFTGVASVSLLFGQMMPAIIVLIPLFNIFNKINLIDTYYALILANLTITLPLSVLMFRSFFQKVPKELEEAALVDGCTSLGAIFRILIPISKPGIISVIIFSFIISWDEYLYALNFSRSASIKTLPIILSEYTTIYSVDWGGMMSASTIVSLPVILIFLIANKYFVKGLYEGSIK